MLATRLENNEPVQWCETCQSNCDTVHPIKRPGTSHVLLVCTKCLVILKKAEVVTLVQRGQPFQHYHLLPRKLVAPHIRPDHPVENETQPYELMLTSAQAVVLRALGYKLLPVTNATIAYTPAVERWLTKAEQTLNPERYQNLLRHLNALAQDARVTKTLCHRALIALWADEGISEVKHDGE